MLSKIVQATTATIVSLPGNCASMTMTANTMLARPRRPNQPTNNFVRDRGLSWLTQFRVYSAPRNTTLKAELNLCAEQPSAIAGGDIER